MKTLLFITLLLLKISIVWGQKAPRNINEIPIPFGYKKEFNGYGGRTLYKFPLSENFVDKRKVGEDLSKFSLKTLNIYLYVSDEPFEKQMEEYLRFYKKKLYPKEIPYTGPINIQNTNEPDISQLKPGEASEVELHVTGEIIWYYRESENIVKRFLIFIKDFPPLLRISEEIYVKDIGPTPLPLAEDLDYPIMPKSVFLPSESSFFYQFDPDENKTIVVGNITFQSLLSFDETVKYFENKLNTKAKASPEQQVASFIKMNENTYEMSILTIQNEPASYRETKISDERVVIVYNYSKPKFYHKIIVNDVEIIK